MLASNQQTRVVLPALAAGRFYPANASQLRLEIEQYINAACCQSAQNRVFAVLVPHAGYAFSAPVAGYSFKHVSHQRVDTVLFVALSHTGVRGACLFNGRAMQTPLGEVKTDTELTPAFLEMGDPFYSGIEPFQGEHSIEVNLPFVQESFPIAKVVSLLTSHLLPETCRRIGKGIADVLRRFPQKRVLICVSSDLSHYPPYDAAKRLDQSALQSVEAVDPQHFFDAIQTLESEPVPNLHCVMCGSAAMLSVLEAAKEMGITQAKVLHYQNSGDSPHGGHDKVVGYGSAALYYPKEQNGFSDSDKKELLSIARKSIQSCLQHQPYHPKSNAKKLQDKLGVFVTVKHKGELRGCLGRFAPSGFGLADLTAKLAAETATSDNRFASLTLAELPETSISISVLSPERQVNSPDEIQPGKHGIKIVRGQQNGTLLPQVAIERNWDNKEFLEHTCIKANLSPGAWKDPATNVFVYEAEVFSDLDFAAPPFCAS